MQRQYKNILLAGVLIVAFGFLLFSLRTSSGQKERTLNNPNNIVAVNDRAPSATELMENIPPELRNLPYAIYPNNPEYNSARFSFNKRFDIYPHAVITPKTPEEAAVVLKLLKKHKLDFSIKSGGHCYEPGSLSSGYIFDLRNFNSIVPDVDRQEVYIGAGCRLGAVIETLGKLDFAIPTGTCPKVGASGLLLGGGVGLLSRNFGLTCDSVKSITLLNSNAEIVEVNEKNFPDLFWALRGAGNGSYGIALGYTFNMYHIPTVSYYELKWQWNGDVTRKVIKAWQSWIQSLPDNISSLLQIRYADGKASLDIIGLKVGDEDFNEWKTAFNDLNPIVNISKERYIDSSKKWAESSKQPFCKAKSKIIEKELNDDVLRLTVKFFDDLIKNNAKPHVFFDFEPFGGKIPQKDTAFFPRRALAWWYQAIYWNQPEDTKEALRMSRQFYQDISPYVSKYSYANTVDYDLGKSYLEAYYGSHVDRLIEIKQKYDPMNVFHWEQSIPLSRFN